MGSKILSFGSWKKDVYFLQFFEIECSYLWGQVISYCDNNTCIKGLIQKKQNKRAFKHIYKFCKI